MKGTPPMATIASFNQDAQRVRGISRFNVQQLPNGLIQVYDRATAMGSLWNGDGSHHSGICSPVAASVVAAFRGPDRHSIEIVGKSVKEITLLDI
jgi:hypothetical protein